jgi:hypothetical protein
VIVCSASGSFEASTRPIPTTRPVCLSVCLIESSRARTTSSRRSVLPSHLFCNRPHRIADQSSLVHLDTQRTLIPLDNKPLSCYLTQIRAERPRIAVMNQLDTRELGQFVLHSPHHWLVDKSPLASKVFGDLAVDSSVRGWREEVRHKEAWLEQAGKLKVWEFFVGCGGTSIGIEQSGYAQISGASDNFLPATEVFAYVRFFLSSSKERVSAHARFLILAVSITQQPTSRLTPSKTLSGDGMKRPSQPVSSLCLMSFG